MTSRRSSSASLVWKRDGTGWLLLAGRRRFGRVTPDPNVPGMWRSVRDDGRPSDYANLSWSKNSVLTVAERELEFEDRGRCATDPRNTAVNGGVFQGSRSPVRPNSRGAP
jgi:hypothetical protein